MGGDTELSKRAQGHGVCDSSSGTGKRKWNRTECANSECGIDVQPFRLFEDIERRAAESLAQGKRPTDHAALNQSNSGSGSGNGSGNASGFNEDYMREKALKEKLKRKRDGVEDWALGDGSYEKAGQLPWYAAATISVKTEAAVDSTAAEASKAAVLDSLVQCRSNPLTAGGVPGGLDRSSSLQRQQRELRRKAKADPMSSALHLDQLDAATVFGTLASTNSNSSHRYSHAHNSRAFGGDGGSSSRGSMQIKSEPECKSPSSRPEEPSQSSAMVGLLSRPGRVGSRWGVTIRNAIGDGDIKIKEEGGGAEVRSEAGELRRDDGSGIQSKVKSAESGPQVWPSQTNTATMQGNPAGVGASVKLKKEREASKVKKDRKAHRESSREEDADAHASNRNSKYQHSHSHSLSPDDGGGIASPDSGIASVKAEKRGRVEDKSSDHKRRHSLKHPDSALGARHEATQREGSGVKAGTRSHSGAQAGVGSELQELRRRRLEREAAEKRRAAQLLAEADVFGSELSVGGTAQFSQQFHPHLARQHPRDSQQQQQRQQMSSSNDRRK